MTAIDFASLLQEELQRYLHPTMASHLQTPDTATHGTAEQGTEAPDGLPLLLSPKPKLDLRRYRVGDLPRLHYVPDFLTQEEAASVLRCVDAEACWTSLQCRRLQLWGSAPEAEQVSMTRPMPQWLAAVCATLAEAGVFDEEHPPNHVLINEYSIGQGIMPHSDGPRYWPCVAILSLASTVLMHFRPRLSTAELGVKSPHPCASLVLRPRSLLVFAEDAFTTHLHGIDAVLEEIVGAVASVINLQAAGCEEGDQIIRDRRVSLTVRHVLPPHGT